MATKNAQMFKLMFERVGRAEVDAENSRRELAAVLRCWRKNDSGFTLQGLADKIKTTKGHLGDIERGVRLISDDMAKTIMKVMGVKR